MAVQVSINGGQFAVQPKVSSQGSRGFFGTEKVTVDGKRYQVQVSLWEIGSKGQAVATSPTAGVTPTPAPTPDSALPTPSKRARKA